MLQAHADSPQDNALKEIQNSQHRVYSMSLIHQKIYQSENISSIDMTVYIPELASYLNLSPETLSRLKNQGKI